MQLQPSWLSDRDPCYHVNMEEISSKSEDVRAYLKPFISMEKLKRQKWFIYKCFNIAKHIVCLSNECLTDKEWNYLSFNKVVKKQLKLSWFFEKNTGTITN